MGTIKLLKLVVFSLIQFNLSVSFAQGDSGAVWVTVDDASILPAQNLKSEFVSSSSSDFQKVIDQFKISKIKRAFPASKNKNLQNVYELQCACNSAYLAEAIEKSVKGLSKPEEAPVFELMYTPNDYNLKFTIDYALDLIGAQAAWDITKGDSTIVLGISDANFNQNNAELVGKVLYMETGMTNPNVGHGTAVAAAVAGNSDNNLGKSSIGFNSKLRLYSMGYNQILQASNDGVKVINMSWASGCSFNSYCQGVIDEIYTNGTIMVASAGNGGTCGGAANFVYPANYNHVISVTSIGSNNNHEKLHNGVLVTHQHNSSVDISAPGYDVAVVGAYGAFFTANGTSFASPYVTGTISLMLAVNPCLNADDVELILKQTAVNIDAQNPTYIGLLGAGRLDAAAAVLMAKNYSKLKINSEQISYSCQNQLGTVKFTPIGGTAPYVFTVGNQSGKEIDSLQMGTFTVHLIDSSGCSGDTTFTISSLGAVVNSYDYPSNVTISSSTTPFVDLNGDGIIKVRGNITIAEGVNFLIESKRIEFGNGSDGFIGIKVKNDATLSITKNTSLKGVNSCKTNWDGIVLSDNKNGLKGGKLILNKVNVYDAKIGVNVENIDTLNSNPSIKYGTFSISNSVFTNNLVGVKAISNSNDGEKNMINKTIFLLEDSLINAPVHIQLNKVNNLVVLKNRFFGNDMVFQSKRGTAIFSENSKVYVAENESTDLENIAIDGNQFYNLTAGIVCLNSTNTLNELQISGSYFTKVNESININQSSTGTIYANEIDVPIGNDVIQCYAIKIGEKSELTITDNLFTTTNLSANNQFGVILNNSDTNKMDVYRNNFKGNFTAANLFEGNNLKTFVDCNVYSGTNDNHWLVKSGKLGDQSGHDVNGQSLIYKNEFTPCKSNNPQIAISENSEGFVYQSKAIYMPVNIAPKVIKIIISTNAEDNQCRNFYDPTLPEKTNDEIVFGSGATIFPNPTLTISAVNWNEVDIDEIAVYNVNGDLVSRANVTGIKGNHPLINLTNGVFFIKLSYKGIIFKTEKLVVSR